MSCNPYLRFALLVPLAGCAGPETRAAFSVRAPAPVVTRIETPNVSADHARSLDEALDRSLEAQELTDEQADIATGVATDALPPDRRVAGTFRCLLHVNASKLAFWGDDWTGASRDSDAADGAGVSSSLAGAWSADDVDRPAAPLGQTSGGSDGRIERTALDHDVHVVGVGVAQAMPGSGPGR